MKSTCSWVISLSAAEAPEALQGLLIRGLDPQNGQVAVHPARDLRGLSGPLGFAHDGDLAGRGQKPFQAVADGGSLLDDEDPDHVALLGAPVGPEV